MAKLLLRVLSPFLFSVAPIAGFAQSPAQFYTDRTITILVGSDAGSGYDGYARLLARHMGRHMPGSPRFIVQNMNGAGGLAAANAVANSLPKDGTAIAGPQSGVGIERLLHIVSKDGSAAAFDATKLNWLGTMTQTTTALFAWKNVPVHSMDDLIQREFAMGVAGPNTDGFLIGTMMNRFLGTKVRIVTGYPGGAAELLAMERGEVDVASMAYASAQSLRPNLRTDGNFRILLQMGDKPHPELSNVPMFSALVKSDDDRRVLELIFARYQMGRPYFVAAEVPPDRVAALQKAFEESIHDPALLAEAKISQLEVVDPLNGAEVQKVISRFYDTQEPLLKRTRQILGRDE